MKPAPKPAALRRHLAPRQKIWLNWDGVFLMGPNYLRFLAAVDKTAVGKYEEFARPGVNAAVKNRAWTAGLNGHLSGKNFRLTFDYLSRKIGEPGVRKGRLLAQVQAKF